MAAESFCEAVVIYFGNGPGAGCAVGEAVEADAKAVAMSVIAPVGVEQAFGVASFGDAGELCDVTDGLVHPRAVRRPSVRARAAEDRQAGVGEFMRPPHIPGLGVIVPVEHNDVFWNLRDDFRVVQDDVAPHVHSLSMLSAEFVNLQDEIQVHSSDADFFGLLPASAFTEFPRLVAADVEVSRLEEREELVVHIAQQFD